MNFIKFGDTYVPIIEEFESTSNISRHPVFNTTYTAQEIAESWGDKVGFVINDRVAEIYQSECSVGSGTTDCHGMSVKVEKAEPTEIGSLAPAWASDFNCLDANNLPLDSEQTLQYFNGLDGYMNQLYYRDSFIYALRYSYPNEVDPNKRRAGYIIRTVERDTVYQTDYTLARKSYNFSGGPVWIDIPYINTMNGTDYYYDEIEIEDEDDPFEPTAPTPYVPNIDDTSDLISIPTDPPLGISSSGYMHVYKPTTGALSGLADILFPDPTSSSDIPTMLLTLAETIANQNLINFVIDCHIIPCAPTVGVDAEIKVGYRLTGINAPVVTSDYVNISCGSLNIAEYYGGFQDYICTTSKLYLPFIGFVDVLPEFWQAGTIAVDYKFNIIDGSFMCYIRSASSKSQLNGSVIASYAGNACIHMPISGVNYANMVSGVIAAGVNAAESKSPASAVVGGASSMINSILQGGQVQQSNGYNATASILGVRTPYLMIERMVPAWSTSYKHDKGLPSNIFTNLQNISGFTIIEDIDLSGIPMTEVEIEELRGLLKEGVYF